MHELRKIASGTKLCLAFNLVKQDSSFDSAHRVLLSNRVHIGEAAVEPWLQEVTEGMLNVFSGKFAIPLKHKYTKTNLSFARLKGDDRIMAEVLKDCRYKTKEKWLDLHLFLVTKHQEGIATCNYSSGDSDSEDADHHSMWQVREQETDFEKCIDLDGNPIAEAFENLDIDVLGEKGGPFNSEPDEKRYEGYTGNDGPTLEYRYHRAMLVAWPKAISASIACEADVSGALEHLNNMLKDSYPHFLGQLRQVILYCRKHAFTVWKAWKGDCSEDPVTPTLLSLCTKVRVLEDVLYIVQLLAKDFHRRTSWRCGVPPEEQILKAGVRNADVAGAIATVVQVFGWEVVSADVINLVKECALTRGESCTELAKQLICNGNKDAGALVAHTVFDILESRTAELESNKKPKFTWCQPVAKLPGHPHIESFLKGPQEKYVHRGAKSLLAAKSLVERFFHTSREYGSNRNSASDDYTAIGTVGEGRVIVIKKTRRMFQVAMEIWHTEQEDTKRLRLELGKARLAVPQNEL